jgi:hypothetical protein
MCMRGAPPARMGAADASMAVLDPQLRVGGTEGLRVIDASSMPDTVGGDHRSMREKGLEFPGAFIKATGLARADSRQLHEELLKLRQGLSDAGHKA